MSYPEDFYTSLSGDLHFLSRRRLVKQDLPPTIPTDSRESLFSMSMRYGQTGSGKSINLSFWILEKYHVKAREHGIFGFKIIWIDILKAELATAFKEMTPDHPLWNVLQEVGFRPESYPVQILRPLVYIRGRPDLRYKQPDIVKPFTIALSDLTLNEWISLFPGGLSPGQLNLHDKALKELHGEIESTTMHDLYVKVQEIVERGDVGYGSHITGMQNVPTITMSKRVFSGREAQGLLQKYQVLTDTSLIMPKFWKGKPVKSNININKILKDQKTITVVYIPQYKDLPHLNMGVINYLLNHIYDLKDPNNLNRVTTPICLAFPELRNFCPKHIPDNARYYIEPIKNTLLDLVSIGAGIGISIDADTQTYDQIPDDYRTNVTTSFIFDMGEDASEKIRDVVKGRFPSNFKEITDDYHLSALKDPGTFIYLGWGRTRAEIRRNSLVGFWYPRARTEEAETETNYYDLFQKFYPKRMVNIAPLYARLLEINMEAQTQASEKMNEILLKATEQKKKRKPREIRAKETTLKLLQSLNRLTEETTTLPYGKTITKLEVILGFHRNHVANLIKKAQATGFLVIDKTEGRGKWKIIVNHEKIERQLAEESQPE